ncbi:transposase InsO family protein [Duganella sp. SG902]|nr:transposase InsO family protein [Duganella sp. SG902]
MFGISRQSYYKRLHAEIGRASKAAVVAEMVRDVRRLQPRVGGRKLHLMLKEQFVTAGVKLGRDGLFDTLRRTRLLVPRRRSYTKTTDSKHHLHKHPNLIKGAPAPTCAEQLWVADITYIDTTTATGYLSLVTDAYSRKIVGYHLHPSLHTDGVAAALLNALRCRKSHCRLIHHSDRGIQYCATAYQQIHQRYGIVCSMTDGYDCYQNALAERVNGILKTEFLVSKPANLEQAEVMIRQAIAIYNTKRLHAALQYKTPDAVHRASLLELN